MFPNDLDSVLLSLIFIITATICLMYIGHSFKIRCLIRSSYYTTLFNHFDSFLARLSQVKFQMLMMRSWQKTWSDLMKNWVREKWTLGTSTESKICRERPTEEPCMYLRSVTTAWSSTMRSLVVMKSSAMSAKTCQQSLLVARSAISSYTNHVLNCLNM